MISKIEFEHQKRVEILSTLEDISSIGVKLLNLRKKGIIINILSHDLSSKGVLHRT